MSARMTAGEAYRLHRLNDTMGAISWPHLSDEQRATWTEQAAHTLSDAAAIRARMGDGWQDISTAPRDGTTILWSHEPGKFHAIHWPDYEECFDAAGSVWHPIPALPEPPK